MKLSVVLILIFLVSCQEDRLSKIGSEPIENSPADTVGPDHPDSDNEETDPSPGEVSKLKRTLTCSLKRIYQEEELSPKRQRMLNFIAERLFLNFKQKKIISNIEKAHLLAQMFHESDGLTATVERVPGQMWQDVLRDTSLKWKCDDYKSAIENDDDYFENRYIFSRNSYRAAFRGRGLIQLTGCYNYLGFLHGKSAFENGDISGANAHKTSFTYRDSGGRLRKVGMFCSQEELNILENKFLDQGLELTPRELVNDFKNAAHELSIPCNERGLVGMKSEEFIVDSTFWYWNKCQQQNYFSSYIQTASDQAVARVTECIHGKHKTYRNYSSINCQSPRNWREKSYCSRKNSFTKIISCFH